MFLEGSRERGDQNTVKNDIEKRSNTGRDNKNYKGVPRESFRGAIFKQIRKYLIPEISKRSITNKSGEFNQRDPTMDLKSMPKGIKKQCRNKLRESLWKSSQTILTCTLIFEGPRF